MIQTHLEIRWKRVAVTEDILNDSLVRGSNHCVEGIIIFDLIYIRPGRQIYISVFLERIFASIDDHSEGSLEHDNHKVILRPPWFRVFNVVTTNNLAGKDIIIDIAYVLDAFLSEDNRRALLSGYFFVHF